MPNTYTAREAAEKLGVSLSTLYAYVSRGLLHSIADPGTREKRYPAELVDEMAEKRARREPPDQGTRAGRGRDLLSWREGRPFFGEHDALGLAATRSVGDVAALLWLGDLKRSGPLFASVAPLPPRLGELLALTEALSPVERMLAVLPLAAESDPGTWDLRELSVARSGATALHLLTAVACESVEMPGEGIAGSLRRAWCPRMKRAEEVLRAAIILAADTGRDSATVAARAVAAARSHPYAVIAAGLCALQGTSLGARTRRITALIAEVDRPADARAVVRARLERGEAVPGFGSGAGSSDPRAALLLELLGRSGAPAREMGRVEAIVEAASDLLDELPTLDFALAAVSTALRLPGDSALTILCIGRSIGWIADAVQEYG